MAECGADEAGGAGDEDAHGERPNLAKTADGTILCVFVRVRQ
jgi:hypothetical protein